MAAKIAALQYFQTQLLKLYFLTTLYVDVKEPAPTAIPGDKKTQFCLPDHRPTVFRGIAAGTKLSPICSPKCT